MKHFFKLFRNFIIILIILCILLSAVFIFRGHSMYSSALEKQDLNSKVKELESAQYYVYYNDIPKDYINAVIAIEDHRFFEHNGLDFIAILRAVWTDFSSRSFAQGGSTITQQLAKNIYFSQDRNATRKIAEIFMASYLEKNLAEDKNLAKEKILELYINTACFNNCYGLGQASRKYFNKEPKDLTLYECTLLAGIPNAPAVYAPDVNMKKCIQRQNQVINAMVKYGYIDEDTANRIRAEQPEV